MTNDMINEQDIKALKNLINQIEMDYYEYVSDDEDIDYEDLKKRIFDVQCEIKAISERWAE